jgi:hypothetical protein
VGVGNRGDHYFSGVRHFARSGVHLCSISTRNYKTPDQGPNPQHGPRQRDSRNRGLRGRRLPAVEPGERQRERLSPVHSYKLLVMFGIEVVIGFAFLS